MSIVASVSPKQSSPNPFSSGIVSLATNISGSVRVNVVSALHPLESVTVTV